jgi:hypothetical protein
MSAVTISEVPYGTAKCRVPDSSGRRHKTLNWLCSELIGKLGDRLGNKDVNLVPGH